MNVFRLFLCLAGLVTFLVIRNFSTPPKAELPLDPEPKLVFPAFPGTQASSNEPTWVDRFEVEGQIVNLRQSPEGALLYDLTTPEGRAVASDLSEAQLQEQHPKIYSLVHLARASLGSPRGPTLQANTTGLQ